MCAEEHQRYLLFSALTRHSAAVDLTGLEQRRVVELGQSEGEQLEGALASPALVLAIKVRSQHCQSSMLMGGPLFVTRVGHAPITVTRSQHADVGPLLDMFWPLGRITACLQQASVLQPSLPCTQAGHKVRLRGSKPVLTTAVVLVSGLPPLHPHRCMD